MTIKLPLLFKGSKGEKILYALFDTGSTYSCIREEFAVEIANLERLPETRYFGTASEDQYLKVENGMRLDFELNDINLTDEFMVVPALSEEVIIGATTLQKWRIKLDFEHDTVIVDPKVAVIILKPLPGINGPRIKNTVIPTEGRNRGQLEPIMPRNEASYV